MGVNSLPKTVIRQHRDCDLNPGPSAPESSTLTTRLPSHPIDKIVYRTIYRPIILTLSCDRLTIVTDSVLRFLIGISYKLIYEHYLRRSYDFASKSYLGKASRSS